MAPLPALSPGMRSPSVTRSWRAFPDDHRFPWRPAVAAQPPPVKAQAAAPGPSGDPDPPLQPTNRASLRALDPALHLLPRGPAPCRNGKARDQRVPVAPRGEGTRQRLDTDAGPERPRLPVPQRPGAGDRPARGRRPCQAARPRAGRSDPGRGEATLRQHGRRRSSSRAGSCTAAGCGCSSACTCASRTSSSTATRSPSAMAKDRRTA